VWSKQHARQDLQLRYRVWLAYIKSERAAHNFDNRLFIIIVAAPSYMMLIADPKTAFAATTNNCALSVRRPLMPNRQCAYGRIGYDRYIGLSSVKHRRLGYCCQEMHRCFHLSLKVPLVTHYGEEPGATWVIPRALCRLHNLSSRSICYRSSRY
jgi:hypothetical protein